MWSDEFNGSSVDPGKWHVRNATYNSYELSYLTSRPQNVSVSGGALTITARRESMGGRQYTSGYLDTIGKAQWRYGRFEMRAKLPLTAGTSKGLWPAFWMRSVTQPAELDVMEAVGSATGGTTWDRVVHTIHQDTNGTLDHQGHETTLPSGELPTDWHTYAVEWEPGSMRFYLDDALVWQRSLATTPWLDQRFASPFHFRLNLQVGGSWPGTPTAATAFPAAYVIDYVRVFQR